jgi:hypothetical protein
MIQVPLLDAGECAQARESVHALRSRWTARNALVPFFTLGAASYLDGARRTEPTYASCAARDNPVLLEHFSWLYARVRETLASTLGAPVEYEPGFALPGFHVFLRCVVFEQPFASVHRDLQYKSLPWSPSEEPEFDEPLSFTLAVALPSSGAGLYTWELYERDLAGLPEADVRRMAAGSPRTFHPYDTGALNVHSGHQLHQIAASRYERDSDERITLQGHGIRCRGVWKLYW